MTDKVQESLFFNCGYITYTNGAYITIIKAENICKIQYFPNIEKRINAMQGVQSDLVTITMKNNDTLKFKCSKENFDELTRAIYALDNQHKTTPSTFIPPEILLN